MSKPTSGKPGFVYIFMNPLFPNWVKIGKAKNWSTRLKNYQQYVPEDYEPVATLKTSNMDKVEKLIHGLLEVCEERDKRSFSVLMLIPPSMFSLMWRGQLTKSEALSFMQTDRSQWPMAWKESRIPYRQTRRMASSSIHR
ncbi:MAG: GIY-YIG nuclease family protein [Kiritimatiellae bacterium]|nr:GIY-YIG nuclease family protein [Kiritimatiellia bacterium]